MTRLEEVLARIAKDEPLGAEGAALIDQLLRSAFAKLEKGAGVLTPEEQQVVEATEAAHDREEERELEAEGARQAELAELARRGAPSLGLVVHGTNGLMELVDKKEGRWAARTPDGPVEDVAPDDCRALIGKQQAELLLERLRAPFGKKAIPSDRERREYLRKLAALDFLDLGGVEDAYRFLAGILSAGEQLGSMEHRHHQMLREHLVRELAAALGASPEALSAQLAEDRG